MKPTKKLNQLQLLTRLCAVYACVAADNCGRECASADKHLAAELRGGAAMDSRLRAQGAPCRQRPERRSLLNLQTAAERRQAAAAGGGCSGRLQQQAVTTVRQQAGTAA
jgi:hypothetical protein